MFERAPRRPGGASGRGEMRSSNKREKAGGSREGEGRDLPWSCSGGKRGGCGLGRPGGKRKAARTAGVSGGATGCGRRGRFRGETKGGRDGGRFRGNERVRTTGAKRRRGTRGARVRAQSGGNGAWERRRRHPAPRAPFRGGECAPKSTAKTPSGEASSRSLGGAWSETKRQRRDERPDARDRGPFLSGRPRCAMYRPPWFGSDRPTTRSPERAEVTGASGRGRGGPGRTAGARALGGGWARKRRAATGERGKRSGRGERQTAKGREEDGREKKGEGGGGGVDGARGAGPRVWARGGEREGVAEGERQRRGGGGRRAAEAEGMRASERTE